MQHDLFQKQYPQPLSTAPAVKIHPSWFNVLRDEFDKEYFKTIKNSLKDSHQKGDVIYPPGSLIFNAFDSTPFDNVKVVILGQDPYHGKGQAHGLCFSVNEGVKPPPSLVNIFKELEKDCGINIPDSGCLQEWAFQGVFLLNAILTVQAGQPASHSQFGWQKFTDRVIEVISEEKEHVVFMLWGRFAQEKESMINKSKHLVLKAAHPSPFSAHSGFFGCRHFSKANEFLISQGIAPVNWQLKG